ncbi:MAG: VanZ family protein [Anaerofustis sp.]
MKWQRYPSIFFLFLSLLCGMSAVFNELRAWHFSLLFSLCMNVAALLFLGLYLRKQDECKKKRLQTFFSVYLLVLYSMLILSLMFLNEEFLRTKVYSGEYSDYNIRNLNLVPFKTIFLYINGTIHGDLLFSQLVLNLFGNLIAMTPLALLLPSLFPSLRKPLHFFLFMTVLISCLELMQYLLKTGVCDIDDLILNLSGVCIVFHFWRKRQYTVQKK